MIGLVTDSNSQIPAELVERYGVEVVPLTVTVDGVIYTEGVDLDADGFYELFRHGRASVSTSQPSPGRFASAYEALARRGADQILSVHIGSALSGTVNSARLAAATSPVPVRVVDTATASFAVTCCLWEAAEAVTRGADLDEAEATAMGVAATIGNVFVVGGLDLARAGGRLQAPEALTHPRSLGDAARPAGSATGLIPVLSLIDGVMRTIGEAASSQEAAAIMAGHMSEWAEGLGVLGAGPGARRRLRVGLAVADAATVGVADALAERLKATGLVAELVRYRVGPSVGAHTGPGAVGAMYYPASVSSDPAGSNSGSKASTISAVNQLKKS